MADPLSQLRQFHIEGKEIKEHNGYIIFGDHGWPKSVNTNYRVYSLDGDTNKKEYYTLECLLYFIKNMDLAHHHYVKQIGSKIGVVHRPDRKNLLAYLKGETKTSDCIDKNAPIPPLRLSTAEIYAKDHSSGSEPLPGTSSQPGGNSIQSDGSSENAASKAKKRPHDPEMEKRVREEFAARLNEPSNKKMATIIPTESTEKNGEASDASVAISKQFAPEKLAAMRAKHLAVKRTTIIDADGDGKMGPGATDTGNKEADLLIQMDSDPSKMIKSKEKIWRTRTSILQAHSKNFKTSVLPMVDMLTSKENPAKRSQSGPMPPGPVDMYMNPYANPNQIQAQQFQQMQPPQHNPQDQSSQRNAYNRYHQESFTKKLDIGVDIDTNKSFVSGVANGLPFSQTNPGPQPQKIPTGMPSQRPDAVDGHRGYQQHHNSAGHHNHHPSSGHQHSMNGHRPLPMAGNAVNHMRTPKKHSAVPIIIIPATTTSVINMYNAAAILQDLTYREGETNKPCESEMLIQRKKPDGSIALYKIMYNPVTLNAEDWNRVVAVFVQGPAWQFKGWPWGGSPVEIFSRIKGFHLKWDESKLDDNVAKWNVHILELSRNKRHMDKANLLKFWSSLDAFMIKHKSYLNF